MASENEPLDASIKNKYELKYLIVQPTMPYVKGIFLQFGIFFGPIVILMFLYFSLGSLFKEDTKLFLFIILQIVFIVFIVIINKPVNKKLRGRDRVGFVQFFPHHMIIEQNNQLVELNYENLFKVYYSNGLLDDYFSKTPNVITYHYKFICKDKTTFFFECECFIRASWYDRKSKSLPDIGYVIKRTLPPGGIHQSKREIRKELKKRKQIN